MTAAKKESGNAPPQEVFISYSRKDQEFVRRLDTALQAGGREAWVDWEGIRPTEEFMAAIFSAIEGADTFVFVLSPDAVVSKVCAREIAHAALHNKRIVPIVARDVEAAAVPEAIAKLNWIFARDSDDFQGAVDTLVSALETDLGWIRIHTRLLTRALEWDGKKRSNSFVLRGEDLSSAEQWLAQAGTEKERQPTALQTEYILASRKASSRRQRIVLGSVAFGAVVALVLAVLAWQQRTRALANAAEATHQRDSAVKAQNEATKQRNAAVDALSRSYFSQGTRLVAEQQSARALAFLAAAVRNNGHSLSAARIATLLSDRVWARPLASQRAEGATRAFFSPDGAYVLAVLPNGSGEIRNRSGERLSRQIAYHLGIGSAHFTPDGEYVVITTGEGKDETKAARSFQMWETKTGRELTKLMSCAAKIYEVSFSDDSRRFALCAEDATYLCGVIRGIPTKKLPPARMARFSANGARLVTVDPGGGEEAAHLWDAQTGTPIGQPLTGELLGTITAAALSPDGKRVATGLTTDTEQGAVRIWDVVSGKPLSPWIDQDYNVENLIFSPDGRWFLSLCRSTAQVFDSVEGKAVTQAVAPPTGAQILGAAFSPDGGRFATAGADGSVCAWDAATGKLAVEMWEQRSLESVGFSADCRAVVTLGDAGRERRSWNILGGVAQPESIPTPPQPETPASEDTAAPRRGGRLKTVDGSLLLRVEADVSVKICDAASGTPKIELVNLPEGASAAEFSPDGNRVLVTATNNSRETVGLWDAVRGSRVSAQIASAPNFQRGGFSPDSQRLVVFGERALHFLDVATGREIVPLISTSGEIGAISFSPDSKLCATLGDELQVWNAQNGQPIINPIKAPRERFFTDADFSHERGLFVASVLGGHHEGDHSASQLFDTATGAPLCDPHESAGDGGAAHFANSDRNIVEGRGDQWMWEVPPNAAPPQWLALLAEAIAGQRLGADGVLSGTDVEQALKEVGAGLARDHQPADWVKLGRWVLTDAAQRTISPRSRVSVREFVANALQGGDESLEGAMSAARHLEEAMNAEPDNALVHARLGLQFLQHEEAANAEHETAMATRLGPASVEAWQARATVLKALERPAEADQALACATALAKPQK